MNTSILQPSDENLSLAAELLRSGQLVAFPTETVYGLGANALDGHAVLGIFEAKGRPADNPLIVHIHAREQLDGLCVTNAAAEKLMDAYWPGPLTLIMPRKPAVPDAVTAGLDTVGMRCPDCAVTREIITAADVPVAAPSGNASGRPSPTTAAAMLEDMDGKIHAILDDGPCAVGVESTIIDLTVQPPRLLRPGGVTLEELEEVLGEVAVDDAVRRLMAPGEKPRAPGMKYRHYAPKAPVTVVQGDPDMTAGYIAARMGESSGVLCFDEFKGYFRGHPVVTMGPVADQAEQARRIFEALRAFDSLEVDHIWAQSPTDEGIGLAVTNRLNKAAGFHIINL